MFRSSRFLGCVLLEPVVGDIALVPVTEGLRPDGPIQKALKDQTQRKALINYFVNVVVLYGDYALFYLNYKEHALKLKLSDIEKSSDTLLNALPKQTLCLLFLFCQASSTSPYRLFSTQSDNNNGCGYIGFIV